jgi:hypothetical protein
MPSRNGKSSDLERQLAALRSALEEDTGGLVDKARKLSDNARTLADWRHHFRRHPAAFCGAAAVLGFLLIPRRRETPRLGDARPLAFEVESAQPALAAALLATVGNLVARKTAQLAVEHGSQLVARWMVGHHDAASEAQPDRETLG